MAGIDKTYTDSYKDYLELKNWANNNSLKLNYGNKSIEYKANRYIYDWNEEDFDGRELPIMNTPTWFDKFLIDNCPCQFVIDRLNDVYGGDDYLKELEIGIIPDGYEQNRKIKIKKFNGSSFPIHNKPYSYRPRYRKPEWGVQTWKSDYNLWYSDKFDAWVDMERYPCQSNTMHVKSMKGLVRKLRKMYLPSGISFRISGRFIDESYIATVK